MTDWLLHPLHFYCHKCTCCWTNSSNFCLAINCATDTILKQYWSQMSLLLHRPVLWMHFPVPSSIIVASSCSLSPHWVNRSSNEGPLCLACPVSYGAMGPNWMRARLPCSLFSLHWLKSEQAAGICPQLIKVLACYRQSYLSKKSSVYGSGHSLLYWMHGWVCITFWT